MPSEADKEVLREALSWLKEEQLPLPVDLYMRLRESGYDPELIMQQHEL